MRWLLQFRWRLKTLLRRGRAEAALSDELRFHLEQQIAENVAAGMAPDEARYVALRTFGGITTFQEECRDMHRANLIENFWQDLRYTLRTLGKTPLFATVVVLTLALGIGANTAIFSVMNAVMLRLLPVRDPARLVYIATTSSGNQSGDGDTSITEYMFEQLRAQKQVFSDVVAFAPLDFVKVAVRYGPVPEEAYVDMVSGDYFSGLGVRASRGLVFNMDDEKRHTTMAVLNFDYWTRRFSSDPSVLGQTLYVKGIPFTIEGIAAPGFAGVGYSRATDVWIPLQTRPELKPWGIAPDDPQSLYGTAQSWWCLKTMARLAPGITEQRALSQAGTIFERAAWAGREGPRPGDALRHMVFESGRGIEGLRDRLEEPLKALMVMVGLVLVIACGNIAMLLAARNSARGREFSLRMALGGSLGRLFRQLLTESLLLVAAGTILGWVFVAWVTQALAVWLRVGLSLAPDRSVLFFTAAISIVVALLFGLAPMRSIGGTSLGLAMKTSAPTANRDRAKFRGSQIVVGLQTSLCLMLLVAGGLLVRTMRNLETADLGMRTSGLLVFGLSPQAIHSDAEGVRFFQALLNRVRAVPGVESATVLMERIGAGGSWNTGGIRIDGVNPTPDRRAGLRWNACGAGCMQVLGIPVLLGRDFTEQDSSTAPRVMIVDEAFVKKYLEGRNPIGHRIKAGGNIGRDDSTIAGVVANSKYTSVREEAKPTAYYPYTQIRGVSTMQVEVRTSGNTEALLGSLSRTVREFAPDLPLLQPMSQREVFENESAVSTGRLLARLSGFFGLLAVVLVATGLYGTLAYMVARRTTEVGLRMALGARRGQVLWMILRQSLAVSLAGTAVGVPLAIASTRLLKSMLFGLAPGDVLTFVAALAGLFTITLIASLIPARRAASVDPIVALRHE